MLNKLHSVILLQDTFPHFTALLLQVAYSRDVVRKALWGFLISRGFMLILGVFRCIFSLLQQDSNHLGRFEPGKPPKYAHKVQAFILKLLSTTSTNDRILRNCSVTSNTHKPTVLKLPSQLPTPLPSQLPFPLTHPLPFPLSSPI